MQPIDFSHRLHAGELGIDCRYCHSRVGRSPEANLPSVARCIGCHRGIKQESEGLRAVAGYWERREPIRWTKVHDLPDHVRFSHGPHVAASVGCGTCHGKVWEMDRVRQTKELSMGFCLGCHRVEGAGQDCLVCHK